MAKTDCCNKRFALVFAITLALSFGLLGCQSSSSGKQPQSKPASAQTVQPKQSQKKSYSDMATAYPSLYRYDPDGCWKNVYDEGQVVYSEDAGNYIGQAVTVEGYVDSVVYSGSSNGSPYFINLGGGAYAPGGFAVVIWSEDLASFDQNTLENFVNWSMSDQAMGFPLRVSGVVDLYNDRPQIVARDGSQVATQMDDGSWMNMLSSDAVESLMAARYR